MTHSDNRTWNAATARAMSIAVSLVLLAMASVAVPGQGQTYTVLHTFNGGGDGAAPNAGLTIDKAGNFYGTAYEAGIAGHGVVFKLTNKNGNWVFSPLYSFLGGSDGAAPTARVVFGPDGTLFGTNTNQGCGNNGTVFNLKPPASACKAALCPWNETVLYCFTQPGAQPGYGDLAFDASGNIYGTTLEGGDFSLGTVFMLAHSGGGWTESILHSFGGGTDGRVPYSGVIFDSAGNLYGTTSEGGGLSRGIVYQLAFSGGGWTENIIHDFQNEDDGGNPYGGLVADHAGNFYGSSSTGGLNDGGTVFGLVSSGGSRTLHTIAALTQDSLPEATLAIDAAGNLYGTTFAGGDLHRGSVYKLTPSGTGWTLTVLYSFTNKDDGGYPVGGVTLDANGNLYGTTTYGGSGACNRGCGVIWKITQ